MRFDVIIGNPPYQLNNKGFGRSATPIYHKFVQQAKKFWPRFLVMIIPARWFAGNKMLSKFRQEMLNDDQIRKIVDFEDANEVFPDVDIAGGVCYFLWERDSQGPCEVVSIYGGVETVSIRRLNEFDAFIRHGKAISIIHKVLAKNEPTMNKQVSKRMPFGLSTTERPQESGDILLRWRRGVGPYNRKDITVGVEMIDKWKVITAKTYGDHAGNPGSDGKRKVFSKIDILPPGTVCTETYLVIGSYDTKSEAENMAAYMRTRLFRFLVSQFMCSHHLSKESYAFVPILDMNIRWTDEMLRERYGITPEEFAFIGSKIRPMPGDTRPSDE